uniref:(northern house mosquito) hypothetical protein n=1 Tax=Culex pipiens TaxID=7175 RepID=A0A8D8FJ06_CULPI
MRLGTGIIRINRCPPCPLVSNESSVGHSSTLSPELVVVVDFERLREQIHSQSNVDKPEDPTAEGHHKHYSGNGRSQRQNVVRLSHRWLRDPQEESVNNGVVIHGKLNSQRQVQDADRNSEDDPDVQEDVHVPDVLFAGICKQNERAYRPEDV